MPKEKAKEINPILKGRGIDIVVFFTSDITPEEKEAVDCLKGMVAKAGEEISGLKIHYLKYEPPGKKK